jgi:hypothetical protein
LRDHNIRFIGRKIMSEQIPHGQLLRIKLRLYQKPVTGEGRGGPGEVDVSYAPNAAQ